MAAVTISVHDKMAAVTVHTMNKTHRLRFFQHGYDITNMLIWKENSTGFSVCSKYSIFSYC